MYFCIPASVFVAKLICHWYSSELQSFVNNLKEYYNDLNRFKLALRDFLIQLKEFSGDDNAELYLEEREAENARQAELAREQAMRIPGMLKPDQLEDKDEDINLWGTAIRILLLVVMYLNLFHLTLPTPYPSTCLYGFSTQ
jgi:hypothetical protein